MAIDITSTTFVHQVTVIEADWCNDVDELTFEVFSGTGASLLYKFDEYGNSVLNNSGAARATTATDGFIMHPSVAGVPTGVPAHAYTGTTPFLFDHTNENLYYYSSSWKKLNKKIQWLCFAASSQTTVITTGTAKATIPAMPAGTIRAIRGFVVTASSSGAVTIDVNLNGTTIMSSAKLVIDENETTTLTAATPPVLTTTAIASGDVLSIDLDGVGTGAKGWGVLIEVEWS